MLRHSSEEEIKEKISKMNSSVCLKVHESKHYLTINIVNIVT